METVSLKFEEEFLSQVEDVMKKNGYATKTEFIREAVRDKISELEKKEVMMRIAKVYGSSKRKTTDEQIHKARQQVFDELAKEFK